MHHSIYDKPYSPGGLWLFDETGQSTVVVNGCMISSERIEELRRLFPEAELWVKQRGGPKLVIPSIFGEGDKSTVVVAGFMVAGLIGNVLGMFVYSRSRNLRDSKP
jgi:hypothetical protein